MRDKLQAIKDSPRLQEELTAASQSYYRLWWECLNESGDYVKALRGQLGEPWAGVARDFGELGPAFELWWLERGRRLFEEPAYVPSVRVMAEGERSLPLELGRSIYIEVPLEISRGQILREFNRLLDRELAKTQPSTPEAMPPRRLYPLQRIRIDTVRAMLDVWKARKQADEDWWQTGERLGIKPQFNCLPTDGPDTVKHKRRQMYLAVQRLYRMSATTIDYAAKGDFPRLK